MPPPTVSDLPPIELRLGAPAHGGACVAHDQEGRLYFVRGGAPGELVRVRITSPQSRLSWAEVTEVIEPSADRISTTSVPGADLAFLSAPAQREWKAQVLRDQFQRVGSRELGRAAEELGTLVVRPAPGDESDGWGRRTRARFRVAKNGHLSISGYRSHQLESVREFPLLDPVFAEAGVFTSSKWEARWRKGETVNLVAPTDSAPLVLAGKRCLDLKGKTAAPVGYWRVEAGGQRVRFQVRAAGFWQTHREAATVLAQAVLRGAGDLTGKNVLELYSGAGLFTYFLAERAARVTTVESDRRAVEDAAHNLTQLDGGATTQLNVGKVDAEILNQAGFRPDLLVLDPPREGADRDLLQAVEADRIVLVSCDPAAAARDLALLVGRGYELAQLEAWDLFPNTHHVETVATLNWTPKAG